jgi:drug/metabolite transporter (DMT)-like permease
VKIILSTTLALIAFAGNSVLCRLALGNGQIDAASFTSIRLLAGIVVLLGIFGVVNRSQAQIQSHTNLQTDSQTSPQTKPQNSRGSWRAATYLFVYALAFSFAYISLDTGTGALILFGTVQLTMILIGLLNGVKLTAPEIAGVLVAFWGLVYLVMPDLSTPSLAGIALMAASGIAWALYSLAGRGSVDPLGDTTFNFARTLPMVMVLIAVSLHSANLSLTGITLAFVSGSITSAIGYTIWYIALRGLSEVQAAVLQLLVPVIAAIGGVMFADEAISNRLVIASVLVLGGVLAVILGRQYALKYTA